MDQLYYSVGFTGEELVMGKKLEEILIYSSGITGGPTPATWFQNHLLEATWPKLNEAHGFTICQVHCGWDLMKPTPHSQHVGLRKNTVGISNQIK
jgi:hypothetical protein